jgi:hypothetical protein
MIKNLLMCLLVLSNFILATAWSEVTVTVEEQSYAFEQQPRLVEVLSAVGNTHGRYWTSAALFESENSNLEATRQMLLNNLHTLIYNYITDDPKLAESLIQLESTIMSWRLAKRLPVEVDYDLARIDAASNPQLPHGDYVLELSQRKNTVLLFGAVRETILLPHQNHADTSQYINGQLRTNLADKDYVIVIQADGRIIKTPVAYWNKKHQEVMPGSQIFVPFQESLMQPEWTLINQQIVTLALNRLQ